MKPPTRWGTLLLTGKEQPYVAQFDPSDMMPGRCTVIHWLKPGGTKGRVEVLIDDGAGPRPLPLVPKHEGSGGGWWNYSYHLQPGMPLRLQIVMWVDGEALHATAVLPVALPRLSEQVEASLARVCHLGTNAESLAGVPDRKSLISATDRFERRLQALLGAVRSTLSDAPCAERANKLAALSDENERYEWRCGVLEGRRAAIMAGGAGAGLGVGTTHAVRKLRRAETNLDYGESLRLRAARRRVDEQILATKRLLSARQ